MSTSFAQKYKEREIIELRHNGRKKKKKKKKKRNVLVYIYNEFPREEEFVDFGDKELCPTRLRDTNDKHNSFEDGYLSHSDSKH